MDISVISTFIQNLMGGSTSPRLIQLTNQASNSATTINSTCLNAAIQFAANQFEQITGIAVDTDTPNYMHMSTIVEGVLYVLENMSGRASNMISYHEKAFFAGCNRLRTQIYVEPQTSSPLSRTSEKDGARPDFDRSQKVWKDKVVGTNLQAIIENNI